jgi:hypothetical protein
MSAWRHQALSLLPEHRRLIESAPNPMAMWIDLHLQFEDAVDAGNLNAAERFIRLAEWCISEQSGALPNDTSTAAALAFYEHLPERRSCWKYFPLWFSRAQFESLMPLFGYHLSSTELDELKRSYLSAA